MDLVSAAVLGVLQGVFEWLPVSSQGQVAAFSVAFLHENAQEALRQAVFLHVGTLFAALVYFRKEVWEIVRGKDNAMLRFLLVAMLATVVTAVPSYLLLKEVATSTLVLLLVISLMLFVTGFLQRKRAHQSKDPGLSNKNAVVLGLAQGFSVIPGISRSGVTTAALLFEGFDAERAFRISFLLSIPAVALAQIAFGIYEGVSFSAASLVALALAFAAGLASIDVLLRVAKRIRFDWFCYAFGVLYLVIAAFAL